jgi:DNA helicase-2/ATP-dependent DNA helicase PcrA
MDRTVNYRCPRPVVERAVRLVAHNEERFVKTILSGPSAEGRLILAPDGSDEIVRMRNILTRWPQDESTRAVLARTNAELLPAAAVALELRLSFRAPRLRFLSEDRRVDELLEAAGNQPLYDNRALPLLAALARTGVQDVAVQDPLDLPAPSRRGGECGARAEPRDGGDDLPVDTAELLAALIGWAAPYSTLADLTTAIGEQRRLIAELRRDDALLTLATAHSTKGLEFDHVAVIGMDAGRFPSARSVRDAAEPERALQEERRLAYVAWTRARRTLTLVYDPASPSPFLLEAFSPEELRLDHQPA